MKEGGPEARKVRQRHSAEIDSAITDREIQYYRLYLGLDLSAMKGKKVLDIGSGINETFSKDAAHFGIEVVSMAPHLKELPKAPYERNQFFKNWQENSVAGRAQQQPFADNSFDFEVALYSVPLYLPENNKGTTNKTELMRFLKEIVRTLKSGGKAIIYPVDQYDVAATEKILKDLSEIVKYEFEHGPGYHTEFRLTINKK